MFSTCRCGSGSLHVPFGQTSLLYKEVIEFLRRPWRQQPADDPELFHLGLGETTRNLPAGECGVSW
jgi:hypothetical protein